MHFVRISRLKPLAIGVLLASSSLASAQTESPPTDTSNDDAAAASSSLPSIPVDTAAPASTPPPPAERQNNGLGIDEVIVTAQKRSESINDVPIAISAFTGEDLAALGVTDTRDLNNLVPGFSYGESGYNTPVYSLRGVGFNEASQTASATVGVYVDEINLPFAIMSKGANLDLERVEVLKGPQGTLYGRNTTGGAINYIARKPTEFFEAGIKGSYGRFMTSDVEGYVSGALTEGVNARLALRDIRSQHGWQISNTRPDDRLGKQDKQVGRLIVDWQAEESLKLSLSLNGWNDASEPQAPQAIGVRIQNAILGDAFGLLTGDRNNGLAPSVRNYPYIPRDTDNPRLADWSPDLDFQLHDRFYSGALRADWDASEDTRLTALGTYQKFRSDGTTIPQSGLGETSGERSLDVDTEAYNGELRLTGNWNEDIDYVGGLFYSHDDVSEVQEIYAGSISTVFPFPGTQVRELLQGLVGPDVPLPLVGNLLIDRGIFAGAQKATSYAAFGQVGWAFAERFKLNLGLRYTSEMRDFVGCTRDSPNNTQGLGLATFLNAISLAQGGNGSARAGDCVSLDADRNPGTYRGSLDQDNVSGRIGLDWKPNPDLLLYTSFSRGFKSGSFPVLSASDQSQYTPVKQEQLDAFEIGNKATLLDGKAQVNAAAFYYRYKDKQLLGNQNDLIFGPLPVLVNAPKSRVIGAELEGQLSPLKGLFLTGSLSYLDTEVLKFVGTNENAEPVDFAGNRFNFAPEWSYTLLANYVYTVAAYDLSIGADYSYKGRTNSSLGAEADYNHPAYDLINARLGLRPLQGDWDVGIWGRNLTNEVTTISIQKASDPFSRYVGMPRTYGLSLSYSFR